MSEKRDLMRRAGWEVHSHKSHVGPLWAFTAPSAFARGDSHLPTEEDAWAAAEAHFDAVALAARELVKAAGMGDDYVQITSGKDSAAGWMSVEAAKRLFSYCDAMAVGFSIGMTQEQFNAGNR